MRNFGLVSGRMGGKVQFQIGRYVHPIYREQMHAVPAGWSYAFTHPSLTARSTPTKRIVEQAARLAAVRDAGEHVALRALSAAGYVHRVAARPLPGATLIHAAERLIWRSPLPYVLDLEHADVFVLYQQAALKRSWTRRLIERALLDDRLRFLLPWSEAARRSVLTVVSPEVAARIAPKLRVVSPAIRPSVERIGERAGGSLRALFVGTAFIEKGGIPAFQALREVRKTHDVTLDIVTYPTSDFAARLRDEPGVILHAPGGADLIQRLYSRADVLLFPSHMDTFGYVVMEAMAHALPVLAPRHLALTETIQDGVSGLLFEPENMLWLDDTRCRFPHTLPVPRRYLQALRQPSEAYVHRIVDTLVKVAEDPALHARLAQGALDSVRSGHLSIPERQAVLGEIYAAAADGGPISDALA
jgi:glycosyltransferase involved in cell wall biosynthesis